MEGIDISDAQISAETQLHNFDMAGSYTAFVTSINDAQHHVCEFFNRSYCEEHGGYGKGGLEGSIPDVVPYYGHGRQQGDPAWGAAYTLLPEWLSTYYRDDTIFEEHYEGLTAHLDQLMLVADKKDQAIHNQVIATERRKKKDSALDKLKLPNLDSALDYKSWFKVVNIKC